MGILLPKEYHFSLCVLTIPRPQWCLLYYVLCGACHSPLPSLYLEGRRRVLFSLFLQLLGQSLAQNKTH